LSSVSIVIRAHWRLLVFILGLVFAFWLLWILRSTLIPFIIGFILAYLMLPIIRWVENRLPGAGKKPKLAQLKRISIILVIYLLVLAIIGLAIFYLVTVIGKSLLSMAQDAPQLIPNGLDSITQWIKSFDILSSPSVQHQIDVYSAQAGVALGQAINDLLTRGVGIIQSSSGMILGFVSMPVFLFFILKDWDKLQKSFQAALPAWALTHSKNIFSIIQNVTGRYIRGQIDSVGC
jgi:predicted PurR-regulated permease PerM